MDFVVQGSLPTLVRRLTLEAKWGPVDIVAQSAISSLVRMLIRGDKVACGLGDTTLSANIMLRLIREAKRGK